MRHSVKTEILQKVMNYLSSRPFGEVNALITEVLGDAAAIPQPQIPAEVEAEAQTEAQAE